MPGLRLHDLRHSFASALVNAGRSIYEVQKLLGHAKVTTTERYAHLANQTLLDATDAAAHMTGITVSGH
jgi:site-specific recombinase XerD